jgi:hypothetical protein
VALGKLLLTPGLPQKVLGLENAFFLVILIF